MAKLLTLDTYYVVHHTRTDQTTTWQVLREGAYRFVASGLTNKEAIAKGKELAKKNHGRLIIEKANGDIAREFDYSK